MTDESDLLDDLETFKESFSQAIRDENIAGQVDMTKKLGVLAEHLGQEITRTELLPFLTENIDINDEILFNLSEQLKQFIPLVGGYAHSQPILNILKKICNAEETVVREKTLETLKCIAEDFDSELTEQLLVPILESLAAEQWFTSKCSAVALFTIVYPKVSEDKKTELRHSFRLLAQDESPIVRKSAAIYLIDLIPLLDTDSLKNEFVSVFDNISNDSEDSVKGLAITVAISLCRRLTEAEVEEYIFKTLESFCDSSSWKIRQILAANIAEIQEVIPYPKLRGKILSMFQKLLKNTEEEVRIVAVKFLVPYCKSLKESYEKQENAENNFEAVFVQSIVPNIALLVVDTSVDVKLTLAKTILSLSTVVRTEIFMEHIMQMVVDILELETSVPVKANIFENLNDLPRDIDFTKSLLSIKNVVRTLIVYSQTHWRTRKGLLIAFMHIATFASKEYFGENLKIFYASLLGDPVFAVRRTAPIILPLLVKQYGMKWITTKIIPYFKMFTKDTRYLYRYIPLFAINELINPSIISEEDPKYLDSLKDVKNNKNLPKLLIRLKYMVDKLKNKLEEKIFEDILYLNKSIDDFATDNISLYAGETLTTLKAHYNQNVFWYDSEKSDKVDDWYLTGLISLIYREFLGVLLNLFDDKIVNVQIRSIFTLNKIKIFCDKLTKEIEQPWVEEIITTLPEEEVKRIQDKVDAEFIVKSVEIDDEKIDTELMDNIIVTAHEIEINNDDSKTNIGIPTDVTDVEYIDDNIADTDTTAISERIAEVIQNADSDRKDSSSDISSDAESSQDVREEKTKNTTETTTSDTKNVENTDNGVIGESKSENIKNSDSDGKDSSSDIQPDAESSHDVKE